MPIDIVRILTAAAPIAASVASMANDRKPENNERKETPVVNNIKIVNITNNYYGISEKEVIQNASKIQEQSLDAISSSETRYII